MEATEWLAAQEWNALEASASTTHTCGIGSRKEKELRKQRQVSQHSQNTGNRLRRPVRRKSRRVNHLLIKIHSLHDITPWLQVVREKNKPKWTTFPCLCRFRWNIHSVGTMWWKRKHRRSFVGSAVGFMDDQGKAAEIYCTRASWAIINF